MDSYTEQRTIYDKRALLGSKHQMIIAMNIFNEPIKWADRELWALISVGICNSVYMRALYRKNYIESV